MNFILKRYSFILIGVLLLIIGLFIQNPMVGILICLILASVIFYDERVAVLFLIITIPIRPFLIIYNTGYKFIGDLLIVFLLLKVAYNYRRNISHLFRLSLLEASFFLFIIVGTISAFITGVTTPAIIMQVRAFLLFFLLFYILKRIKINSKDINDFALITFVMAVILSVQGLVEKISVRTLFLPKIWEDMELAITNKTRVYGLIGGPNELGLYLIISFIISFYLLSNAKGKLKTAIYIGMTLIFTVFLLTYSRGAVLALISFVVVYLLINRKIPYLNSIILIGLSSAVLFFAVVNLTNYVEKNLPKDNKVTEHGNAQHNHKGKNNGEANGENGLNRFSGAFSKENIELSSADGRAYYVKKAIEVFKDRPIVGYGFGTFGGAATQTYSSPIYKHYGIGWNFYSDNQYIQILAETGIVGTVLIILFVLNVIKTTWTLRKEAYFSPLLIFFIVAAIVSGTVYNILENDVFTMYYFIALGFAHHYLKNGKEQNIELES